MSDQQQAASVKRYDFSIDGDSEGSGMWACADESDDGEYVKYTDYAAAIAERDAAQKRCDELSAIATELRSETRECSICGVALVNGAKCYCMECGALHSDLVAANRTIKAMGEAADAELTKLREQVAHQTDCINAMAETCAKDKKEIERLTGLIDEWKALLTKNTDADVWKFLNAHDAERPADKGEG